MCVFVLWTKIASALEGLNQSMLNSQVTFVSMEDQTTPVKEIYKHDLGNKQTELLHIDR